jgi:hypothetical protein
VSIDGAPAINSFPKPWYPLPLIVLDELCDGSAEVSLPYRNDPVETFVFDRSDEALCVGVSVRRALRRQNHLDPSVAELASDCAAPFPISIANQHAMAREHAVVGRRHNAHHLRHEQIRWMRRGPENPHAAGRQIDHERRVVRDQALPRPDFRGEEIRPGDHTPMGLQERLPGRRTLRDRRKARCLQDSPNGRTAHAVANVLERA